MTDPANNRGRFGLLTWLEFPLYIFTGFLIGIWYETVWLEEPRHSYPVSDWFVISVFIAATVLLLYVLYIMRPRQVNYGPRQRRDSNDKDSDDSSTNWKEHRPVHGKQKRA